MATSRESTSSRYFLPPETSPLLTKAEPESSPLAAFQMIPNVFQRLEHVKERLSTEYLQTYLDASYKAWYIQLTATYLAQHLLETYRRQVEETVRTVGPDGIAPHMRQYVMQSTTAAGTPAIQLALDTTETENVAATLVRLLEASDQAIAWNVIGWRLATELSTWALEKISQTLGMATMVTMAASTFEETLLTAVQSTEPQTLQEKVRSFLTRTAQHAAFDLATTITTRTPSLNELEHLLGFRDATPFLTRLQPLLREDHLTVLSAAHYQAIREVIAKNSFQRLEGMPWPTALLKTGPARGHAQLRPIMVDTNPVLPPEAIEALAQRMWQQRETLSDLDADALDTLSALWLYQARTPQDDAIADVDELLAMRGLRAKLGGQGRRGGYRPAQRAAMLQALVHIQSLWLHMTEVEVYEEQRPDGRQRKRTRQAIQSRAFTITDIFGQMQLDGSLDVQRFIFRPGKVFASFLFGPGRQTALLSAKALAYDPYRQTWEKRLARYLSYQWRCRAHSGNYMQTFKVKALLDAVGEQGNPRYPARLRERLEKALDTLQYDKVINGWQYDRWEEEHTTHYGWVRNWFQASILIEPPDAIKETYQTIARHETPAPKSLPAIATLGMRLQQRRRELGLSQIQAAEQLGISPSYLNRLERDQRGKKLSATLQYHIEAWMTGEKLEAVTLGGLL
jgi:DNA-binding XRE family transcriptional regulator